MGFLDGVMQDNKPADTSAPQGSGCGAKLAALLVLPFALAILAGVGSFIPAGVDEALATVMLLWSTKALFGIDLAPFLHAREGKKTQQASPKEITVEGVTLPETGASRDQAAAADNLEETK